MILTVTLNPAIDKLLVLKQFSVHKLHRLESSEKSIVSAGGKGINIAVNLHLLNNNVIASGFTAGYTGHLLADELRRQGITTSFIFSEGLTRTNISILDQEHETLTEINDFGHEVPEDDLDFFLGNYDRLLTRSKMVVLAGSLPRGVPADIYGKLIEMAHLRGIKAIIHTSPPYLDPVLNSSPFMIVPDMRSYHEMMGKHCDGIPVFLDVGKSILVKNKDTELVVFIHRIENVVAVTRSKSFILRPRELKIVNMLGYADAYLAGFIHAHFRQGSLLDSLIFASAAGLSNVEAIHKEISSLKEIEGLIDRINIEEIE